MTAKRSNGANGAEPSVLPSPVLALSPVVAINSFRLSQHIALEAAKFWARRMHAYADQFEALVACAQPTDLVEAQSRFIQRMQDDYVAERETLTTIWKQDTEGSEERPAA